MFTFIVHQEPLQMGRSNEEARKRLGAIADRHPAVQNVKSLLHTSSRTLFFRADYIRNAYKWSADIRKPRMVWLKDTPAIHFACS